MWVFTLREGNDEENSGWITVPSSPSLESICAVVVNNPVFEIPFAGMSSKEDSILTLQLAPA